MILDRIVANKKEELKHLKTLRTLKQLRRSTASLPATTSFIKSLDGSEIRLIAEIKKGSPSRGIIRADFDPLEIAGIYSRSGATAISVLTEEKFFLGSPQILKEVRQVTSLPLLRKDFIIDPWQVYESRLLGADMILLIAAILDDAILDELLGLADELQLECLVEVHTKEEMHRVMKWPIKLLGINNRDLRNFRTDLNTTFQLAGEINDTSIKVISESGINTREDVELLNRKGIHGILVGEALMREGDIGLKIKQLMGKEEVA